MAGPTRFAASPDAMMTERLTAQSKLADLLFSGLGERPMWHSFLEQLASRLDGRASAFIISASGITPDTGAVLAPVEAVGRFAGLVDAALLKDIPFGEPQLLPAEQGPLAIWGKTAVLRLPLEQDRSIWLVTVPHGPDQPLAEDWRELLSALQPLLAKIVGVYLVIGDSERRRLIAEYVLETSGVGVALVDAQCGVLTVNSVAHAIMAETGLLGVRDGRLCASRQSDQKLLAAHVRTKAAEQSATLRTDCYATMALLRDDNPLPVTAIIRPGPPFGPISAPLRRTAVIVLRDPARRLRLPTSNIEHLFNLTPAEARLAQLLAEGHSVDEAAMQLGVSKHTTRSQLQAIFNKTGTNRQGELVRMLLSSAATLTPAEEA